ncbi:hypothetical protein HY837_00210 [archaeon]|nr:hypothetical protein [archaeon]
MNKLKCLYNTWDPNSYKATFLAIKAGQNNPYVWAVYSCRSINEVPASVRASTDTVVVHRDLADILFKFEKERSRKKK